MPKVTNYYQLQPTRWRIKRLSVTIITVLCIIPFLILSPTCGIICLCLLNQLPQSSILAKIKSTKHVTVRAVSCSFVYRKLSGINCTIYKPPRFFDRINFLINFYCKYFIGLLYLIYDIYRLFNCIFP